MIKIINQRAEIIGSTLRMEELIEVAGRNCYHSEDKIKPGSYGKFIRTGIKAGHGSVLEHGNITVRFLTDRGIMAELTRHRHTAFSIESTRYCGYDDIMTFIRPHWVSPEVLGTYKGYDDFHALCKKLTYPEETWLSHMYVSAMNYRKLKEIGTRSEDARGVLPNALKTDIICTANVREWHHILTLRRSKGAHPDFRRLLDPLLQELKYAHFSLFDHIK